MSDDKKKAETKGTNGNGQPDASAGTVSKAKDDGDVKSLKGALSALGIDIDKLGPVEHVQQGGVTKWLDMKKYMVDPTIAQNMPAGANGDFFAGLLLGRHEIEDEKGEENADGVLVRHFYTIKLATPAHCYYKDEDNKPVSMEAKPLDIIALGERHSLRALREWAADGGTYLVIIKPHSRIRIGGQQTMWTFEVKRIVINSPPPKVEVIPPARARRDRNDLPF